MKYFLPLLLLIGIASSCAVKSITRSKNITYLQKTEELPEKQLNVFAPKKASKAPVLIFIHGGSWHSGRKEIYDFMGSRLARRGVVTVIIDYPLAPDYQVPAMEKASARAVQWVKEHISNYGGNPEEIYVSGHSAGGHLAALLAIKNEPWNELGVSNPLKGAILNDPAGLDWYWFLNEARDRPDGKDNYDAFTDNPDTWKAYSPIYFLTGNEIPMLIMEGEKTYPGIRLTIDRFKKEADSKGLEYIYSYYPKTKHIPMVTQFFFTWSKGYKDVLGFMGME
ncbi:alpha/beta hydrolase [Algoriphagus sanaruensis]|uniref:Esterase n=1 Tax=Algoriphagus sanaruensis TaxID=1727163 RepID=A0A142EMU9_9BACT|nr:alpha/beta hydrolase [Algoriphagus sanaruensis]AMQ56454.1 esterase [Algoriphagus sanaruensis]